MHFILGINIAIQKFALISISEAGGYPEGHFRPFLAPYIVQDGPDCASIIHFILGINVALQKFVLKLISEAGGYPDGQFWAISGHF